jgi:DNA-binding phage protein
MSTLKPKSRRTRTRFDLGLEEQLKNPEFAREFHAARAEIAVVDKATNAFLRALDRVRIKRGLTKAELARRIGAEPAVMRRLVSAEGQNPTLTTLSKVAAALRMEMELRDAGAAGRSATRRA